MQDCRLPQVSCRMGQACTYHEVMLKLSYQDFIHAWLHLNQVH